MNRTHENNFNSSFDFGINGKKADILKILTKYNDWQTYTIKVNFKFKYASTHVLNHNCATNFFLHAGRKGHLKELLTIADNNKFVLWWYQDYRVQSKVRIVHELSWNRARRLCQPGWLSRCCDLCWSDLTRNNWADSQHCWAILELLWSCWWTLFCSMDSFHKVWRHSGFHVRFLLEYTGLLIHDKQDLLESYQQPRQTQDRSLLRCWQSDPHDFWLWACWRFWWEQKAQIRYQRLRLKKLVRRCWAKTSKSREVLFRVWDVHGVVQRSIKRHAGDFHVGCWWLFLLCWIDDWKFYSDIKTRLIWRDWTSRPSSSWYYEAYLHSQLQLLLWYLWFNACCILCCL